MSGAPQPVMPPWPRGQRDGEASGLTYCHGYTFSG